MIWLKPNLLSLNIGGLRALLVAALSRLARVRVPFAAIVAALARLADSRVPSNVHGRRADW